MPARPLAVTAPMCPMGASCSRGLAAAVATPLKQQTRLRWSSRATTRWKGSALYCRRLHRGSPRRSTCRWSLSTAAHCKSGSAGATWRFCPATPPPRRGSSGTARARTCSGSASRSWPMSTLKASYTVTSNLRTFFSRRMGTSALETSASRGPLVRSVPQPLKAEIVEKFIVTQEVLGRRRTQVRNNCVGAGAVPNQTFMLLAWSWQSCFAPFGRKCSAPRSSKICARVISRFTRRR
mmetsp:Transcript_89322/g.251446  ORF Transcript_89322/g.251446 Transcript_89322/m.251446 type:complete len:237 (-) Transcript_89322:494-1204(-)